MVKALSVLVLLFLVGCAALGIGQPRTRTLPLGTKLDPEYGRCVSGGYEVDVPPHATIAFVASTCVRAYDAGAAHLPTDGVGVRDAGAIDNAAAIEPEAIPGLRVDAGGGAQ